MPSVARFTLLTVTRIPSSPNCINLSSPSITMPERAYFTRKTTSTKFQCHTERQVLISPQSFKIFKKPSGNSCGSETMLIIVQHTLFMMKFNFTFLLMLACFLASGQRYLQLETINDPLTIKYVENQKITFMSKSLPEWQSRKIEKLMIPDSLVLFYDGYLKLQDFAAIQTRRPAVGAASVTFGTFGAGWLAFALIDELYQPGRQLNTQNLVIGGSSLLLGYTLHKFFYKRTHKLGSRYRLRLIDLSIR